MILSIIVCVKNEEKTLEEVIRRIIDVDLGQNWEKDLIIVDNQSTDGTHNILKEIGTGIYLSNLHYLNWSDRPGGRITGMTRYACFWVENGEVVAPIENMRFDDSIYNFFGENLEAVTNKAYLHPTVETYDGREMGGVSCPGILLKSFELTL